MPLLLSLRPTLWLDVAFAFPLSAFIHRQLLLSKQLTASAIVSQPAGARSFCAQLEYIYRRTCTFARAQRKRISLWLFSLQHDRRAKDVATIGGRTEPRHIGAPAQCRQSQGRLEIFANWDDFSPPYILRLQQVAHTSCAGFPDNGCEPAPPPTFALRRTHLFSWTLFTEKCRQHSHCRQSVPSGREVSRRNFY